MSGHLRSMPLWLAQGTVNDYAGTIGVNQDLPSKTRTSAIVFPENFYRIQSLIVILSWFFPVKFFFCNKLLVLNKLANVH